MAIVNYAGSITECLTTDGFPSRPNGWFLKHIDNGKQYHRVGDEWKDMELGLSFAPPTKSGVITTDVGGAAVVTFGTPFVDDDYTVVLTCGNAAPPPVAQLVSKASSGFEMQTRNAKTGLALGVVPVSWLATRNYNA